MAAGVPADCGCGAAVVNGVLICSCWCSRWLRSHGIQREAAACPEVRLSCSSLSGSRVPYVLGVPWGQAWGLVSDVFQPAGVVPLLRGKSPTGGLCCR